MDFGKHIEDQYEPFKSALKDLVRIPSVYREGDDGYPFGKPIDDALQKTLEIARVLGFSTVYGPDGYYGYAETGEGKDLVVVLGHVDVVPAGDLALWVTGPFDPDERDGKIFGRGAKDDKGPILAALFAAKALMESGERFNKRLRFIFGADEEKYWRCMKLYNEREEVAQVGFTPDAKFPLIYAEKGLLQFTLSSPNESGITLAGGSAFNAVPDHIFYDGDNQAALADQLASMGYAYEQSAKGIKVIGKASHAMSTEKGVNAISRLCLALNALGTESRTVRFVADKIGEDYYGTHLFGVIEDEPSGKLRCNVGKIKFGRREKISIDVRVPVTVEKEGIEEMILKAADEYGLTYTPEDWWAPLYIPKTHHLIQTLMRVYQEVTHDLTSEPISSGGATYARTMKNCVAFGPQFPHGADIDHMPNEHIVLKDMYEAMTIYARAIYELTR